MAKILVVEDDPSIREDIVDILTIEGHEVTSAENGALAIESILVALPELILCDITMPIMDGYAFYTWLRTNPATESLPFAYLTAKSTTEDLAIGESFMVNAYITKPFTVQELLDVVHTLLNRT